MVSSGVSPVDASIQEFERMKLARHARFLIFKVDESGISVETVGDRSATFDALKAGLPADQPRYAVYDYAFDKEGSHQEKLIFIVWSPENSAVRSKMIIASSKENFKRRLEGVTRELQATDASELTLESLDEVARRI
jgi:cofilin